MKKLFVFTDGGAIDNPGPAAIGVVIKIGEETITKFGKRIGTATNNVAEYQAVIEALEWIRNNLQFTIYPAKRDPAPRDNLQFFLDSTLVVNQLNGVFKVKEPNLRNLIVKIRQLEQALGGGISYQSIPREKNFAADLEVKKALSVFPNS